MTSEPVLVLGIGNLLLGDEGAGIHALRLLADHGLPPHVTLVDGGTGGFNLLGCFAEYRQIVIIDAALDDRVPGTVAVLEPRYASDFPRVLSAHDIGLRDLLETATLLGPLPRLHLVTISIAPRQAMGLELSAPVQGALPGAVAAVLAVVAGTGGRS